MSWTKEAAEELQEIQDYLRFPNSRFIKVHK